MSMPLPGQQRGWLSPSHTNSALSNQGPRVFTPELCLCKSPVVGLAPAFSSARGKIPPGHLAVVPTQNDIFCFSF